MLRHLRAWARGRSQIAHCPGLENQASESSLINSAPRPTNSTHCPLILSADILSALRCRAPTAEGMTAAACVTCSVDPGAVRRAHYAAEPIRHGCARGLGRRSAGLNTDAEPCVPRRRATATAMWFAATPRRTGGESQNLHQFQTVGGQLGQPPARLGGHSRGKAAFPIRGREDLGIGRAEELAMQVLYGD